MIWFLREPGSLLFGCLFVYYYNKCKVNRKRIGVAKTNFIDFRGGGGGGRGGAQ